MTDSTADLRHKLDSAGQLQSVVRTMKAIAASSLAQYDQALRALADYQRTLEWGISVCFRHRTRSSISPVPQAKAVAPVIGAVVFGSDQGLVGRFNEVIVDFALDALRAVPGRHRVWAVGERARSRLEDAGVALDGLFGVPMSVQAVAPLVGEVLTAAEAGGDGDEVAELHLFYNRPTSGSSYAPLGLRLLPLDEPWRRELASRSWPTRSEPETLGDEETTLRALLREYLFICLFRASTASLASENSARLAAMQRADKNIDEMQQALRAAFHRVRQSRIDEELFEVVAGFEALSKPAQAEPRR